MKINLNKMCAIAVLALCSLPAMAQMGSGYYRVSNVSSNTRISIANDKLNYHTIVNGSGGAKALASNSYNEQEYAFNIVGKYLQNDIHLNDGQDIILPGEVLYAEAKNNNPNNIDYNLIAQGTSLLTLTTGMYDGSSGDVEFTDLYLTIKPNGNHYTASIDLVAKVTYYLLGFPISTTQNLGTRYFVDEDGTFAISTTSSGDNAKWDTKKLDYFNVVPQVELNEKWYTTLKVPFAFNLSGSVEKAYAITVIYGGELQYQEITGTIPAGTPVLLQCSSPNAADCRLNLTDEAPKFTTPDPTASTNGVPSADETSDYNGTNLLIGTYYDNNDGQIPYDKFNTENPGQPTTAYLDGNHRQSASGKYVIGKNAEGKLGFIPAANAGLTYMPANKAWLTSEGLFPTVAAPTISLAGGTYNEAQSVTITAEDGTAILYSTDGGTTWNEYNEAIPIGEGTTTIQAKAIKQGLYNDSEEVSATYTVEIPVPELTMTPESMTISDATASIFTITGTDIEGNINVGLANTSDWYLNPETLSNTGGEVNVTYTGRALTAENTVNAYVANNPDVKASASVNYKADVYIVTDNGSTGNWDFNNGTMMANENGIYTATFTTTVPNTFILFARKLGDGVNWNTRYVFGPSSEGDWWMPTNVAEQGGSVDMGDDDPIKLQVAGEYTITINANDYTFNIARKFETLAAPEFTPAAGTYEAPQSVTITAQQGATIYYTTDGTDPTTESAVYSNPIAVNDGLMTIKAIAVMEGWNNSEVAEATYTINLPVLDAPVIVPEEGQKNNAVEVTITAAEDAEIYYRINEAEEWTKYTEAFTVDGNTQKVEAYAKKANFKDSPVTTATYTFAVAELTFTPAAGAYDAVQNVEIATETTGAAIQYSINDGEWVDYTGAINVGEGTTTIKAKATKDGYTAAENTAVYVVEIPVTIVLGDVNEDGLVNIADVTKLIDYLLDNSATPFNRNNADVKQDGNIDIADVTSLIDLLLNQ